MQMKKLTIKPFKKKPKLPEDFEQRTWAMLQNSVTCVYTKKATSESKEELYRAVEDMCMHNLGKKLYDNLRLECEKEINHSIDTMISKSNDNTYFLSSMDEVWQNHCQQMNTIRNIFLYLDRSYAIATLGIHSLWDVGLHLFRSRLESRADVETALIVGLLASVESDRVGQSVDEDCVKHLLKMLLSLGQYHNKFEVPFLIDTERFFIKEGQAMVQISDPADFLIHIERRLAEAVEMTNRYLDVSTKAPLLQKIEDALLKPHVSTIAERGLTSLLETYRLGDLRRMYLLLDRVNSTEMLKLEWIKYVRRLGENLATDSTKEKTLIEEWLIFYDRMETILRQSFGNNDPFKKALRQAFEYFLNITPGKTAELLVKYVDRKMRGEKDRQEQETDRSFDRIMTIFQFMQSKDVFEAFYKKSLAKRLLYGKSASTELEKSMISRLKAECGANYTAKLEGMFSDVDMSTEVGNGFKIFLAENDKDNENEDKDKDSSSSNSNSNSSNRSSDVNDMQVSKAIVGANHHSHSKSIECAVQVLTVGFWPINPPAKPVSIPPSIQLMKDKFETYYLQKYQGRRLVWAHSVERCLVTARFVKGKKELELSLYQALCLICFGNTTNEKGQMGFRDILEATNIDDEELRRTLQSLACGIIGTRVLTKHPKGKDVNDSDTFTPNKDFTHKMFRIKINSIQLKETTEDTEKTHEEVFRDRQYQVDAVVVRTMKVRKRISHVNLMGELLSQLTFPANTKDLKNRIESLIERDYLARDPDDQTIFNYIA